MSSAAPAPPHHVAFVVLPQFSFMGLAAAIEPLFVANWLAQRPRFRWSLLSVDGLSVRATNGIGVPMDGPAVRLRVSTVDPEGNRHDTGWAELRRPTDSGEVSA